MTSSQAQINMIMKDFDFEKIKNSMLKLNWEWKRDVTEKDHFPSIEELELCAEDLLNNVVIRGVGSYISTGGFVARYHPDGGLELQFCISNSYCEPIREDEVD